MAADGKITPVILSGGAGTRLWPVSRAAFPKQLIALLGERTMLEQTLSRVGAADRFAAPLVICNEGHHAPVAAQLAAMDLAESQIVLEPVARNTAPAACVAALLVAERDPEGVFLLLPSDHFIADRDGFLEAAQRAAAAAREGWLVTFGVKPKRPETGYGYIRQGEGLSGLSGCRRLKQFVEKPDLETARDYLAAGQYLWNSGMFVFQAARLIAEMERLQPEILAACRAAIEQSATDGNARRLDEAAFGAARSISIDYAVMEHTTHAAVVPVDIGWSDVGSWQTLWEISPHDADDNAVSGDVLAFGTKGSYLRSDGPLVAAIGVEDLAVIATPDAILVCPRDKTQQIRDVVDALKDAGRSEHIHHAKGDSDESGS